MADVTGTIRETFDGKSYDLRLTMRGIASLQAKFGNNIAGLLDDTGEAVPDFNALLALVSAALQKGSGMDAEAADDLADEMLTKDQAIFKRVIGAAFPEPKMGNAKKPKKAA